jgi:hypothetical protein
VTLSSQLLGACRREWHTLSKKCNEDLTEGYVEIKASMLNAAIDAVKSIVAPLTEYDTGAVNDIVPNPSVPIGSNPQW